VEEEKIHAIKIILPINIKERIELKKNSERNRKLTNNRFSLVNFWKLRLSLSFPLNLFFWSVFWRRENLLCNV